MFFLGALVFVAVEITSFVVVAEHIGFFWALAILLILSALGPFIVKRVGFGIVTNVQERLGRGEVPTRELLDGLVVLVGGVMICIPGFVSDALGLMLMVRPVRDLVLRMSGLRLARRVQTMRFGNWHAIDVDSQPKGANSQAKGEAIPLQPGPPPQPLPPDDTSGR